MNAHEELAESLRDIAAALHAEIAARAKHDAEIREQVDAISRTFDKLATANDAVRSALKGMAR